MDIFILIHFNTLEITGHAASWNTQTGQSLCIHSERIMSVISNLKKIR